jgi:hypothetical protein
VEKKSRGFSQKNHAHPDRFLQILFFELRKNNLL